MLRALKCCAAGSHTPVLLSFCMQVWFFGKNITILLLSIWSPHAGDTTTLGNIIEPDSNYDFIDTGGLYILPNGIPSDGKISGMRAFGALGDGDCNDAPPNTVLYLRVLAFREESSGSYNLLYDEEYTHNTTRADKLDLDWDVKEGDLIGAFIPYHCTLGGNPKCPSRINQRILPEKCFHILYFPVGEEEGGFAAVLGAVVGNVEHGFPERAFDGVAARLRCLSGE